jgi:signal transduction histidine kinase
MAHGSIAPVVAVALFFTSKVNSWKADLFVLIVLGAVRGVAINVGASVLDLAPTVSSVYKVFNSAISLPLWFIGIAIFVESRRQYQQEFEALSQRYVRKAQSAAGNENLDLTEVSAGESIKHLQSATAELAHEIESALDHPTSHANYAQQKSKIQELINKELRPASAKLWNSSTLSAPKLSVSTLLKISLLEQRLKVTSAALFFSPYLFIGLNGTQGWRLAATETILATFLNILIYQFCETLFKKSLLSRRNTNITIIALSYVIPFLTIVFILSADLFWTDSIAAVFVYQLFLSSCHVSFLLAFNLYKLLGQQRSIVLASFERIIQDKEFLPIFNADVTSAREIASSLLLERASKTGDTDLARHALKSAVDILSQDHAQVSQSRVSFPQERLEKISSGWRGIAQVRIDLDWIDDLEISTQNDVIALIDEGVSNAIRHAKASLISVTGSWVDGYVNLEIRSNGAGMTQNAPGLGTKLFTELATSWDYSRTGEQNILKFTIRTEG